MGRGRARTNHEARVHRVMDHVREHLADDLSLNELARVAACSAFHFHRLFKALTGETLTTFVQRARLERAAYLMMTAPERRLDDIALTVGFSEHSDFTRVFKRHYGVVPSRWDRSTRLDPVPVADDYTEIVERALAERPPPDIRTVDRPERHLVYVRTRTPFVGPPLREGYERLTRTLETHGVDWRSAELSGWSWDNHETTPIDRVCFDFGFDVGATTFEALAHDETLKDAGLGLQHFAAHRAVQARCQGPLLDIAIAWETLYKRWLPEADAELADLPSMKIFERRPDELGWDEYDLWCSIPLT